MPEALYDRIQRVFQARLTRGIANHSDCRASQGLNRLGPTVGIVLAHIQNRDIGAGSRQSGGHCPGEDPASADNYRHLAGQ